jgi:hypothetical protein
MNESHVLYCMQTDSKYIGSLKKIRQMNDLIIFNKREKRVGEIST